MRNAQFLQVGGMSVLSSRRGNKVYAPSDGGLGLTKYININTSTGAQTAEILAIGSKLWRLTSSTVVLSYTGSGISANCSCLVVPAGTVITSTSSSVTTGGGGYWATGYWATNFWNGNYWNSSAAVTTTSTTTSATNADTWHFYLFVDGVTVLDVDLGVGYDVASPLTLAQLKVLVDAAADFSMTVNGDSTTPAAFLPSLYIEPFNAGTLTVTYYYWTQVNQPSTASDPFGSLYANRNDTNFVNASSVNLRNVLYLGSGYDEQKKYDGVKVYRAGVPTPSSAATTTLGGTGITGTNFKYLYTYVQTDARGNRVESIPSAVSAAVSPANQTVSVTLQNIQNTTGFNTDMGKVNGNQSGAGTQTGLTVTNPHTLRVGDIVSFFDKTATPWTLVNRTLTAVTSTTISWTSTTAVTVLTNDIVSCNLRIALYRLQSSGTTDYYLVAEIPNDSSAATQVYADAITDAVSLANGQYLTPVVPHGLPPKGRYLTSHQGLLCVTGQLLYPNRVDFSDVDSPEYFSADLNSFETEAPSNEANTGIISGNEFLLVFKKRACFAVTGVLTDAQFRVDLISTSQGCSAHATLADIRGDIWFCGEDGVYRISRGSLPERMSDNVNPIFNVRSTIADRQLVLSRAVAVNDQADEKYLLYFPAESTDSGQVHPNANSIVLVFDYFRGAWLQWSNLNMAGGIVVDGTNLYWSGRRFSTNLTQTDYFLYKRNARADQYDQVDHVDPISFEYVPGWESLGEPAVYKKFLRWKGYSVSSDYSPSFSLRVQTEKDYVANAYDSDFSITFGSTSGMSGAGWSITPWGSVWGDSANSSSPIAVKSKLKSGKAQSLRYTFSHETLYEVPYITGWETEIVAPFRPAIKA